MPLRKSFEKLKLAAWRTCGLRKKLDPNRELLLLELLNNLEQHLIKPRFFWTVGAEISCCGAAKKASKAKLEFSKLESTRLSGVGILGLPWFETNWNEVINQGIRKESDEIPDIKKFLQSEKC
uniref:Uncharacterized protein n=1 Tax=Ananas comosus var. bracteatus TaxID=296719 RepID=A0A6V7QKY2_ANACO|nr:unnamed protein product [Ananas comosus var. bracteatus]